MTDKELFQQAKKLGIAWDSLTIAIDYLDMVSASVNAGNAWAGQLFFTKNRAGNVVDNMQNIADSIMAVNNAIYPDKFNPSEVD